MISSIFGSPPISSISASIADVDEPSPEVLDGISLAVEPPPSAGA